MAKILHIIVRHRDNPHPKYPNQWLDDDRIRSIVTYTEIADLCAPLVASASPVRIHRTGGYEHSPAVCCEAMVLAVRPLGDQFEVEFTNVRTLYLTPPIRPYSKESWYFAEAGGATPGDVDDSVIPADVAPNETAHPRTESSVQPNSDPLLSPPKMATPASGPAAEREPSSQSRHLALLRRGIEDWNFARKSKPDVKPNLEGADLREALGKAGCYASVQLAGAHMPGANLSGLAFHQPVLVEASLAGADLTGVKWQGAQQPNSTLVSILESMHLNLRTANLDGANLSRTSFERPCLHGASLRRAKLIDADFSGSMLAGICFDGADLRRANLRGADLTDASFDGADLCGADLSTATITKQQVARALTDSETKLPVDWEF
jgi:uncharacterized protein YjbI with pentapeptide repeats